MSVPANVTIAPDAGASPGVCNITFQVVDANAASVAGVFRLSVYLSDKPDGSNITAKPPAGGMTRAGSTGVVKHEKVRQVAYEVLTDANGKFVLMVTSCEKTGYYPAAVVPGLDKVVAGLRLTAADYR